jgi:histidinol dehydrogenase
VIPIHQGEAWLAAQATQGFSSRPEVESSVQEILTQIRVHGDEGLRRVAERLGDPSPGSVDFKGHGDKLGVEVREVLERAAQRIEGFARTVVQSLQPITMEQEGFTTGLRYEPIERAACYVPGGRYPLPSTALMTALTARASGVSKVSILTPSTHPAVLYAAELARVDAVFQIGGAQAVAAVAYGTESVPHHDLVVGPGNAYVTEAKRQLQGTIGIDMLAGPSEVTIVADADARADWIALDLLAQAEHDPDARVYLLTPSSELAEKVSKDVTRFVGELDLPDFLEESLPHSALLVFDSVEACLRATDHIAPEHLHLHSPEWAEKVRHYGGLFLSEDATVPFGDYMAGPNHTLPTGRTARFTAGLSPLTFLRPQAWLQVADPKSLAEDTAVFADLEGLKGHAAAARARLESPEVPGTHPG